MGLDTYAARRPLARDVYEITDEACGLTRRDLWALRRAQKRRERVNGMCIFERNYFRGKLYDEIVEYVTGVSLGQRWIPPETVAEMAERFQERDPEEVAEDFNENGRGYRETNELEIADLATFFGVCARRGLGLVGTM